MRTSSLVLMLAAGLAADLPAQDTFGPEQLERARELHRRAIVVDTHSDVTPKFEDPSWDFSARHDDGHMDIPRMRAGGLGCEFLSIYMGRTEGDGLAIKTALTRIDAAWETVRRHPGQLEMALAAADVRRIHAAGRIACLMGIEGGHIIEDSLPALRQFHRLGCRYMTLTHSFNTGWADSSGVQEGAVAEHGGLSARGEEIVREMNRLGMMVDISHVSKDTFEDALRVSSAPVIASHSSCRALCEHRRNLDDEQLQAVARAGGVVQINFFSGFIDPEWGQRRQAWEAEHDAVLGPLKSKFKANRKAYEEARAEFEKEHPVAKTPLVQLARHVEHAAKVAGWDHVGIGADWDGVPELPEGMQDCAALPNLSALLLARGAREEDLVKFLGGNLLRVLEACEKRAAALAAADRR